MEQWQLSVSTLKMLTSCGGKFGCVPSLMCDIDFLLGRGSQPWLVFHTRQQLGQSSLLGSCGFHRSLTISTSLSQREGLTVQSRPPPGTRDPGQGITKDSWTWDLDVLKDHEPLVIAFHFPCKLALLATQGREAGRWPPTSPSSRMCVLLHGVYE